MSVIDGTPSQYVNLCPQSNRTSHACCQPINQPPRSTSVQGFQPQTINGHGHDEQDQGSVFPVIQSHQPAYENVQSTLQPSSFQHQTRGPRYSLPNPPSSSGFVPLNQWKQDPGLPAGTGPTPGPGSYGTPSVIAHHTGFASISSPTPVPLNFMPTSASLPFQLGYHNPHRQTPMLYGLPLPPMTMPPVPQTLPQQQYSLPLPPKSSSPHQLASSPIQTPEHGSSPHTPSPPQDVYSQLQGEQPVSNPNSRPLPQPSMITRRRSTLPVPPGGGGITMPPASGPPRPEGIYSGGNYQQPVQSIQYNNIPPPPPLPPRFNAAHPQNQSHITGQAPPLPPPPPQRSLVHSHSHSYSLPNTSQSLAVNGQHGLPIPPMQQNGQHNLPVQPVQQGSLPFPALPPWRSGLPLPPTLQNPPTQQPIYVPPPPPLTPAIIPSYPNQLPQPPMKYADQVDSYLPHEGGLYRQPTVWNYR